MTRGRGSGRTYPKVVELLQQAIEEKGQTTVEQESGLSSSMVSRLKRGIGEPSTATLERLSYYFKVPVSYLRGDDGTLDFDWGLVILANNLKPLVTQYSLTELSGLFGDDSDRQYSYDLSEQCVKKDVENLISLVEGIIKLKELKDIIKGNIKITFAAYSFWLVNEITKYLRLAKETIIDKDRSRLERACIMIMKDLKN